MAKSIKSRATPAMLRWCREKSGYTSLPAVARSQGIEPEVLDGWENGIGTPTLAALRGLSVKYKYPLMIFYLPSPPTFQVVRVRDFRTLRNGQVGDFSPRLILAIRRAQERQSWVSDLLLEEGAPKNSLVGSVAKGADPSQVARNLREAIGITIDEQERSGDGYGAFSLWRRKIESLGIFVFQAPFVPIEEMRGFALPDEYAPVAVINSADSINAKIFTLLHEVVHILLGESALTGSGDFDTEFSGGQSEEQFCNRVAAEVVIPESDIRSRINSSWDLESLDSLKALCRIYKTSQAVVAIRLSELGLIHADALREMLAILQSRRAAPDNDRDVRIPTYRLALSRNGEQFSRIAIEAFHNGAIHGGELSSLVNMKLKHLPALEFELFPERIQAFA